MELTRTHNPLELQRGRIVVWASGLNGLQQQVTAPSMALSLSYSYKRFVSGAVVYYSETVKYLAIYTIGIYLRPTAVSLASLHRCSWSVTLFEVSSTRLHNGQDRTVPCVSLCIYRSTTTPCSYRVLAHAVPSTIPSQCFWCVLSVLLVCSFSWQSSPSNHRHDSHT